MQLENTGSAGNRGLLLTPNKSIGAKSSSPSSRLKAKFSTSNTNMQYIKSDVDGKEYILTVLNDDGGPALDVYALWYE